MDPRYHAVLESGSELVKLESLFFVTQTRKTSNIRLNWT